MSQNKTFQSVFGALAAATFAFSAAPALANSAAAADIAAPLRAAEAAKTGASDNGDEEFHQLFASWQALDTGSSTAAPVRRSGPVSIPSLIPVTSSRSMSSGFGLRVHPVLGGCAPTRASIFPRPLARRSTRPPMASSAAPTGSAATASMFSSNMAATWKRAMATCRALPLPKARSSTRAT
jgi:hypothetical protein